ncbi:SAV_2336 N-terminal domain-related protein [Streptomyces violaceus]
MSAISAVAPELDATALAEALWLASRMAAPAPPGASSPAPEPEVARLPLPPTAPFLPADDAEPRSRPLAPDDRSARPLHERLPGSPGRVTGHAVALPGATALPFALEVTRALRPWKRPWRNGRRHALDLDATVDGYARSGELIPAFAPAPERWFDLVLVIDRSPSMQVWRETVDAFAGLLDRLGAFRTLQVRDLVLHSDSGIELTDRQGKQTSAGQLGSPDGRRLIMVVSDCTAAAWRGPEMWQQLRAWAQQEPVAVLNPLPSKLWRRTGLDLPIVRVTPDVPGTANKGLAFHLPPLLARHAEGVGRDAWLALPVLSLSPHSLGRWSRAVMLAAPDGCSAALVPPGGRLTPLGASRTPTPRSPEERTEGFLRTAAPAAARLALLTSAFDRLSLQHLHVLRRELVPEATTEDLAELLGSGLYTLDTDTSDRVILRPAPQVRERLEQVLTEHEALQLSRVLSRHISSGRDSGSRLSAVAGGADGTDDFAAETTPVGMAWSRTLELLGLPAPASTPHGRTGGPESTGTGAPSSDTISLALRVALALLPQNRAVTPKELNDAVDAVIAMLARQDAAVDRSTLLKELETAVAQFVSAPATVLEDPRGHIPWLRPGDVAYAQQFWYRYRTFLEHGKAYRPGVVHQLDEVTDALLSRLEDPRRPDPWRRSGLVIAPIGFGKATTVIGLAAKAIDAGYLTVVILAGTTNVERAQMQRRVDEGLLGFDTASTTSADRGPYIGAGAMPDSRRLTILSMTDSTEHGDFTSARAMGWAVVPDSLPHVLVVKRNVSVVDKVYRWLVEGIPSTDRPLLVIDTTDGGTQAGNAPSALDAKVRRLLSATTRTAYVGYTYAPVPTMIQDLVPDFVYSIPTPPDHVDPGQRLPLVRMVVDQDSWLPTGHRADHVPPHELPDSLSSAIDAFVLASAARRARGQAMEHNSMLVSVSRFVAVQAHVRDRLAEHVKSVADWLREPGSPHARRLMSRLEYLWRTDFVPTSAAFPDANTQVSPWDAVSRQVATAAREITVITVNGSSDNMPRWHEHDQNGLSVVAVGGAKLGPGTVLEGLTVSYCLRSSSPYETLRQLTVSLGYRTGYEDLCRLYATHEVLDAQERLTAMIDEQRQEISGMAELGIPPREAAMRFRLADVSHSVLADDPPLVRKEMENLSGKSWETSRFTLAPKDLRENFWTLESFVRHLGEPSTDLISHADGNLLWRDVPPDTVLAEFLDVYRPGSPRLLERIDQIRAYIRRCVAHGELGRWTVQLVSPSQPRGAIEVAGHRIGLVVRNPILPVTADTYAVRRLSSIRNEVADLDEKQYGAAIDATRAVTIAEAPGSGAVHTPTLPSRVAVNAVRRPDQALLTIYLIRHPIPEDTGTDETATAVVGFAVSFPVSLTSAESSGERKLL